MHQISARRRGLKASQPPRPPTVLGVRRQPDTGSVSSGIPGNAAAVFLILAMDSIGGFNPGPSVFPARWRPQRQSDEPGDWSWPSVIFTTMFDRQRCSTGPSVVFSCERSGVMARIPKARAVADRAAADPDSDLCPGDIRIVAIWIARCFSDYCRLPHAGASAMSPLPFVIAFILGGNLEANSAPGLRRHRSRSLVLSLHQSRSPSSLW